MSKVTIKIFCKNIQKEVLVPINSTLAELYDLLEIKLDYPVLCAKVNNKTKDLSYVIYHPKVIEFLDATSSSGMRAYARSLCFILYKAVQQIIPNARLRIEHPVSNGLFCHLNNRQPISETEIAQIKTAMQAIVAQDIPFERIECTCQEAIALFKEANLDDKVQLLETSHQLYTTYYKLDNTIDYYYSCLAPSTGRIKTFDLLQYDGGILLLPPKRSNPKELPIPIGQPLMLRAFSENVHFNHIAGTSNVGGLNKLIEKRQISDMLKVTEALHEKKISYIADEITARNKQGEARVILISGPSSSGKTTFAKRLSIQLMTNLRYPHSISLDNYFVEREQTPLQANGEYDFESLYALDLELFNNDLTQLLAGETVNLPTYNFETGKREYKGNKLKLTSGSVLILEGIHALNPALTPQIADNLKYDIYVSALTAISIDDHNWIPTTDNRLLRRIIRDYKFRGYSAQETISRWSSVRAGEEKWIFPFQENADALFNSSLLCELAILKQYAEPILKDVPRDCLEYGEANRLLTFLSYFQSIQNNEIPRTSLLREFLGGSSFIY